MHVHVYEDAKICMASLFYLFLMHERASLKTNTYCYNILFLQTSERARSYFSLYPGSRSLFPFISSTAACMPEKNSLIYLQLLHQRRVPDLIYH
jgi:hypothetical protein